MAKYCAIIVTEETEPQTLVIETFDETSVNASASISSQPIVSGDTVADHMYRNAKTMTINGSFSIAGSPGIVKSDGNGRLDEIQQIFERLMNDGIQMTIARMSYDSNRPQFVKREHMVLDNIRWTERINSVDYSFSFTEALTVDIQEFNVDITDDTLPAVTDPKSLSFSEELLDDSLLSQCIINTLQSEGFLDAELLQTQAATIQGVLIGATVSGVIAIGVSKAAIAAGIAASTVIPGAVVAVVVVAGIVALGFTIASCIKQSKYRVKAFKYHGANQKKNKEEIDRLVDFIEGIRSEVKALDKAIKVYQVQSDERQSCILAVDDSYLEFVFDKVNAEENNYYTLDVYDLQNNYVGCYANLSQAKSSFYDLEDSDIILSDGPTELGTRLYVLNANENRYQLKDNMILMSSISIDDFNDTIQKIITNALLK